MVLAGHLTHPRQEKEQLSLRLHLQQGSAYLRHQAACDAAVHCACVRNRAMQALLIPTEVLTGLPSSKAAKDATLHKRYKPNICMQSLR